MKLCSFTQGPSAGYGIVTEAGIVYPPFVKHLRAAVARARAIDWSEEVGADS